MTRKTAERESFPKVAWWVLGIIIFVLVIGIRIRLLGIPLERDEGEYAYAGQLILQGIPPYKLAYNMKFPGIYAAYALVMSLFGQTIVGIHLGLLLVNVATVALIFLLGRRLFSATAGVAAAITYAVVSMSQSVFGMAAHAEHFVMLPVLGGTLLLLGPGGSRAEQAVTASQHRKLSGLPKPSFLGRSRLFASGLVFGIGLLMKQPAVFFILFGGIYLLWNDLRREFPWQRIVLRELTFGSGAVLPFVIACLLLWKAGGFDKFWFWTIDYARQYGSLVPLTAAPRIFWESVTKVIGATWALWALAAVGVVAGVWNKGTRACSGFLLALLAFSTMALSSGFYFREHYFILTLPAISMLAGVAISRLEDLARGRANAVRLAPVLLLGVALVMPILGARKFCFEASPAGASRIIYGLNPFPESIRIAEYVRDHTSPAETIAILGSEPQIYFYSSRHSATGYIYAYGLMEPQPYARQMQQEMIQEIERARPKFLLSVEISTSWLRRLESEKLIFTWANDYIRKHYNVVGLVNIVSPDHTDHYFGQLPKPMPQLSDYILIFQRKD